MNGREAAGFLRVGPVTLWRLCRERGLPHVKLSPRSYRFRRADLESWMSARTY